MDSLFDPTCVPVRVTSNEEIQMKKDIRSKQVPMINVSFL